MSFEFNSASALEPAQADNPSAQPVETAGEGSPAQTQAQEALDLNSVQKFKFEGREWTQDEFKKSFLMQQDYTKKTQALAEERKYSDNLADDLRRVSQDPKLADSFKSIYPEKYHAYLDFVLKTAEAGTGTAAAKPLEQEIPAEYQKALKDVQDVKSWMTEQRNKAIDAEIDAVFDKYSKKHPHVDSEMVLVRAQNHLKTAGKLDDAAWGDIFKSVEDQQKKLFETWQSSQVKEQKTNSQKAFAGSPGGATPGTAPRVPKTIAEATKMFLEDHGD